MLPLMLPTYTDEQLEACKQFALQAEPMGQPIYLGAMIFQTSLCPKGYLSHLNKCLNYVGILECPGCSSVQ